MKIRIIIASVIVLVLSVLVILTLQKSEGKRLEITTTETLTENTKNETTTSTTSQTMTKKTTTKKITTKVVPIVKVSENEITSYLYQRVLAYGWNTEDYNAVVNIIIKESGFNPNAVNKKSGACGLFQACPCKDAIKEYPDYMTNYKSQIEWGLKYIKNRPNYGTPTKAWAFWQTHHWY